MRRGQAFEVFRLLIAAVIAGAILMVLFSIIRGIWSPVQDPQRIVVQYLKNDATYGGYDESEPITFSPGKTIDLSAAAREAGMSTDKICVGDYPSDSFEKVDEKRLRYKGSYRQKFIVYVDCDEDKCGATGIACEVGVKES